MSHNILLTTLRARFQNASNINQTVYLKSKVILLISPLQTYYNDKEKFVAMIDLINRKKFKEIWVVVGDTNNQHNLIAMGKTQTEAFSIAQAQGNQWISEYSPLLKELDGSYSISRWKNWLMLPEYEKYRVELDKGYKEDPIFKKEFLKSAHEYLSRQNENRSYSKELMKKHLRYSLEYLKEECAIIMPLWAEKEVNFITYPSKVSAALQKNFEIFVKPYYNDFRIH